VAPAREPADPLVIPVMSTRRTNGCPGITESSSLTLPSDPAPTPPADSAASTAENPSFDATGSTACIGTAEVPSKSIGLAETSPPLERFCFDPELSCPGCAHVLRDPCGWSAALRFAAAVYCCGRRRRKSWRVQAQAHARESAVM